MKKYFVLAMTLVLTAAMLAGCGCTNRNAAPTTTPTVFPTTAATTAPTETTAPATSVPTTNETVDRGNGGLPEDNATDSTGDANGTVPEGRTRGMIPGGTAPNGTVPSGTANGNVGGGINGTVNGGVGTTR